MQLQPGFFANRPAAEATVSRRLLADEAATISEAIRLMRGAITIGKLKEIVTALKTTPSSMQKYFFGLGYLSSKQSN